MKPTQLILRCYAERVGDQTHAASPIWQAFCLDFCLAAQGDTFQEVREKLEAMIAEYVYDALCGEDKEYAEQLLARRAPLYDWLKYYCYSVLIKAGAIHEEVRRLFNSLIPLEPSARHRHA